MYLIPAVVISNDLAFHTINHKINKYVGDPVNILKILSDYEVNEIAVVVKDLNSIRCVQAATPFLQRPISVTGPITEYRIIDKLISCGVDRVGIKYSKTDIQLFERLSVYYGRSTLIANVDIFNIDEINDDLSDEIISLSENVGEVIIHDVGSSGQQCGLNEKLLKFVNKLTDRIDIRVSVEGGFINEAKTLNNKSAIYYSTSYIYTDKRPMDFNNIMIRPL